MRLVLSQYLHSLKERDEFDALLPDLLLAMGYVPVSHPQTGPRQFGVDLAVVGQAEDGTDELLLLVIKQGDIGRANWDSGQQAVRPSLNEVLDVYLKSHVEPAHEKYRKKIILATTGDMKQNMQPNWDGYTKENKDRASFEFWGGDKVACLVEQYLLNENIFKADDRKDLRKALALAGEESYDQRDLHDLFLRQLGLTSNGELSDSEMREKDLIKGVRIVSLAAQIFARWSEGEGNLKQSLIASERAMLWVWHRLQLCTKEKEQAKLIQEFTPIFRAYYRIADEYFKKIQGHLYVKDGLAGFSRENALISLNVFEQIGLVATIGLNHLLSAAIDDKRLESETKNAEIVADGLVTMLRNNPVSGSPRLDENVVDISLGFLLLVATKNIDAAKEWLTELIKRIDFTLKSGRNFPICSDSLDDLVEFTVFNDAAFVKKMMNMSWILPTLAGWSVILNHEEAYNALAKNTKEQYPEICLQLWHPTKNVGEHLYFHNACRDNGESEAPIYLPDTIDEYRSQMIRLLELEKFDVLKSSSGFSAGLGMIDFIAYRHFRTPIAPTLSYKVGGLKVDVND